MNLQFCNFFSLLQNEVVNMFDFAETLQSICVLFMTVAKKNVSYIGSRKIK